MREIKFRVWDKVRKKMLDVDFISESLFKPSGYEVEFVESDDFVIMQYIGLKDKNGKEVYEGDFVRCSRGCPHEVIWLKEYGGLMLGGMPAWYLSGLSEGYAWTDDEEIIGNIYENPELLGDADGS